MAAARSNSSTSGAASIKVRDFINKSNRQITLRGAPAALYDIKGVIDQGYDQQLTPSDGLWCALNALEISTKPICESVGVKPLEALKDFLRVRMGLEYAQWATQEHAMGHVSAEVLATELMAHNYFSADVMAQVLSLAASDRGQVFQLGVCSQSDRHGTWDVYLCECEEQAPSDTVWVINDNVEGREEGKGKAGGKALNHWSGIGPDAQDDAAEEWGGKSADKEKDVDDDEAELDYAESAGEEAPSGKRKKGKRSGTHKAQAAKKARVDNNNQVEVQQPYRYRKTNDAPPANTDLPREHMVGITPEELWVYFPNHCQAWPALALRLVNAGSSTSTSTSTTGNVNAGSSTTTNVNAGSSTKSSVNAASSTTSSWQWLADSLDKSRLLQHAVSGRERYALPNTINKKMTSAVKTALGVSGWDKSSHKPLQQNVVENMPQQPPQGFGRLERPWPLWRIGANLARHDWPGAFRDRVIADMLAHPQEVAQEQARLAGERHYDVNQLYPLPPLANPPAALPPPPLAQNSLSTLGQTNVAPNPALSQVHQPPSQPNFVAPTAIMVNPNANGAQIPSSTLQRPADSTDDPPIDPSLINDPSNQPANEQ